MDKKMTQKEVKNSLKVGGISLRAIIFLFTGIGFVLAAALLFSEAAVTRGYKNMDQANDRYILARQAANDLNAGSDYLTDRARCFAVTGELAYLNDFFEEVKVTKRRENALVQLETIQAGSGNSAYESLSKAMDYSNKLMELECLSMRLVQEAKGYDDSLVPEEVSSVVPDSEDEALAPAQKMEKAQQLIFDDDYMAYKELIGSNVSSCTQDLIETSGKELEKASSDMERLLTVRTVLTIAFLLCVLTLVIFISTQIRKPLTTMVELMKTQQTVPPAGAAELQFVTGMYNDILEENRQKAQQLTYEASHDALTGLYNRSAYEMFRQSMEDDHVALLIVDVDKFKEVNDTWGHDVGDRVLKRVAQILRKSFRSVDVICRVGGDEFVVLMTRADSSMKQLVMNKIGAANMELQNPEDDLPKVSLSVGAAFSDRKNPKGDLFKDADTALYRVKQAGRNGCMVYE